MRRRIGKCAGPRRGEAGNSEKNVPSDSDVLLRERSVTVKKSQGKGKKQRCPKILYRVYISLIEP